MFKNIDSITIFYQQNIKLQKSIDRIRGAQGAGLRKAGARGRGGVGGARGRGGEGGAGGGRLGAGEAGQRFVFALRRFRPHRGTGRLAPLLLV